MKELSQVFYFDLNGRVECQNHIGFEATTILSKSKSKSPKTITTSMTKWHFMDNEEAQGFADLLNIKGSICETCRNNNRRKG